MQKTATTNANKCHNKCTQMPQQMQTNATTNAKKMPRRPTNANKCRVSRQKMDETYVKLML